MIEMIQAKLNGNWELILPEHRAARPEWTSELGWERARLDSMYKHIGKTDVVYYCGVELGEMSALCELWGAKTVLFEPNHSAWPSIRQTYEANGFKPLKCFAGFASNHTELIPPNPDKDLWGGRGWEIQEDGWPLSSTGEIIEAHGFSELYQEADGLPQVKIDDFDCEPPTVITFDCEGSGFEVLKGAEQTIRKYKPKIWASWHREFKKQMYGLELDDVRQWLIDLGYKEVILADLHEQHCVYFPESK